MDKRYIDIAGFAYRNIYIVEDRNHWAACKDQYVKELDLVLTMDFGLKMDLASVGGNAKFLDHLIKPAFLEEKNFALHRFLAQWYRDGLGNDPFVYEGVHVGNSLQLNVLNDITYTIHFFFNLVCLREFSFEELVCCVSDRIVLGWLEKLGLKVSYRAMDGVRASKTYFFPISVWMQSKLERVSFTQKLKRKILQGVDRVHEVFDYWRVRDKPVVYIQSYYPTRSVIEQLAAEGKVELILAGFSSWKGIFRERRMRFGGKTKAVDNIDRAISRFRAGRVGSWNEEGIDLSGHLYSMIDPKLPLLLLKAYGLVDDIVSSMKRVNLRLMVPVTDLWMENRLLMNYCRTKEIPVFMIINGLLINPFANDARDSDWVNCYGAAIREDYFANADNVVCLGDPRMDAYSRDEKKVINRKAPVIIIGAAGYSPIDLNSYLAYEFDFLYDILRCLRDVGKEGRDYKVILKVRANGYTVQYQNFLDEYFPEGDVVVVQDLPFTELIGQADLYISFYSQTLFEASALGIPALYYKKDTQLHNKPYDGSMELVTSFDYDDLRRKIVGFFEQDPCFDNFLDPNTMAKYIGPLDGTCTKRNVEFIYSLLQ